MAESTMRYPGRCELCGRMLGKAQMTRHLRACVARKGRDGKLEVKLLHLVVESRYLPMYWLHLEVPGSSTLEVLDMFLRDIWLECCHHMSCFTIDRRRYSVQPLEGYFGELREESMRVKMYSVLHQGLKFTHEYDFGSTTDLTLRVVGTREGRFAKYPGIVLLARNEPPPWECSTCGKPATQIRGTGWGLEEGELFCDNCVDADEDERYLPLVNSPRTGVCGYAG